MREERPQTRKLTVKDEFDVKDLKYDANGLIPAIIQDADNGQVLMMAYMNEKSLRRTLETGLCNYWSRSRNTFWLKGETSGHFQEVENIYYDCDRDTLLFKVRQIGVACHTGERTCFYKRLV